MVGSFVGIREGLCDGLEDGNNEGEELSRAEGAELGEADGPDVVGAIVGLVNVGMSDGDVLVGTRVGGTVGFMDEVVVGLRVGSWVGLEVGTGVGTREGFTDGYELGDEDNGICVGATVGAYRIGIITSAWDRALSKVRVVKSDR